MPNSAGTYNLSVLRTVPPVATGFTLYVWKAGDRPDAVAYRELGNGQYWWAIFDLNPEIIDPLNVPPGSLVRIPVGPVTGQSTLIQ
jgi:hypothetical protein